MSKELKEVTDELEKDIAELGDDPQETDETDWKAEALRARGIAKRNATRVEKLKTVLGNLKTEIPPVKPDPSEKEKKGFDYAQLAEESYLNSKGVPEEDHEYIREISKNTGQPLKEVLGKGYVQGELKDRMEARRVSNATPTSTRASGAPRDTVEYWMDKKDEKGESVLPPLDQTELRRKVLNARIKREEQGTKFTNEPVVK